MTVSELYSLFLKHPVITTDSRNCPPNSLFFALKGEKFNGHDFIRNALQAGCSYAVVDNVDMAANKKVIVVDSVLCALQQLAQIHRKNLRTPVISITGTNGKTTTKELVAAVLSQKFNVLYTLGNLNNHIGVPLTILRLTRDHEMAVIEMGANHPGEIAKLSTITCPNYGLITNIGYAHLEGFGSLEGVLKSKGELYDYLRITNGTVFIHRDNNFLTSIAKGINNLMYYGDLELCQKKNEPSCIGGKITNLNPCLSFTWQCASDKNYIINTNLVGGYNLWNALAAIAVGVYFDVPHEKINKAIEEYKPTNNRSQLLKTKYNELIIDAYNANPSSMRVAIENFATISSDSKSVILGDMLELGEKSQELHAAIIKQIEGYKFEKVLLCGEQFSNVGQQYDCFPTVEKLCEYLESKPLLSHYILIKGSRGIQLERIVEKLQKLSSELMSLPDPFA